MTDTQNSAPTEMAGWTEWADDTQNSAIDYFFANSAEECGFDGPPPTGSPLFNAMADVAAMRARITELEAYKAAEPDRMREVVEALKAIELYASNHGGWFEHDAWLWGQSMGAKAKEALATIGGNNAE